MSGHPPAALDAGLAEELQRLHRRFVVLSALRWAGTGCLIPTTVVLMQSRGLSLAMIGTVAAVQGVVVLVLELPTGGLADTIGPKKVLLAAGALDLVALSIFAVAHSAGAFALAWGIQGVFRALDSGPLEAWYVDRSFARHAEADIERGIAHSGAALSVAISAGALLAAGLVTVGPIGGVEALVLPVLAALVLRLVDLVAVARLVTDDVALRDPTRSAAREVPAAVRAGLARVWSSTGLRALVAIELFWAGGLVAVEALSGPRLFEVLGDPEQGVAVLGVTAAVGWSISGAGSAFTPVLVRWSGSPARAGILTRFLQGGSVALMAAVAGPVGLVTGYLGFYLVHGAANAVHYGMLHRLVSTGERTTVLSVSSLVARIGGTISNVGLGLVAAGPGIGAAFALSALLLVAGAPLYRIAGRTDPVSP